MNKLKTANASLSVLYHKSSENEKPLLSDIGLIVPSFKESIEIVNEALK